jgi:outer membrane biosynthesis protein TonB
MSNRFFYTAFVFSLIIHIALIVYFSAKNNDIELFKPRTEIEVVYDVPQPVKEEAKKETVFSKDSIVDTPRRVQDMPLFPMQKDLISEGPEVKDVSKMMSEMSPGKEQMPEIKTLDSQHKISIPMVAAEKISNPQYLTYNQTIRQKIMQRAYNYVDHPDFQSGEVYLTFILARDGDLRDINIIEGKTYASEYLRGSAIRSVKEASPFPPFPQDLNYPELTFNVIISFEISD